MEKIFAALEASLGEAEVIEEYPVGVARVYITSDGRYLVSEPHLLPGEQDALLRLAARLFRLLPNLGTAAERERCIEAHAWKEAQRALKGDEAAGCFERLKYFLERDLEGYGMLGVPVNDPRVEEVFAERFDCEAGVLHRSGDTSRILDTNIMTGSPERMRLLALRLAQRAGGTLPAGPAMAGTTHEGHRIVVACWNDGCRTGESFAVYKACQTPVTMTRLVGSGAISSLAASYLWLLNDAGAFGLVTGTAGSGKTTLACSLASMSRPDWRVLLVGETRGLEVPHRHSTRLDIAPCLPSNPRQPCMAKLLRTADLLRPDLLLADGIRTCEAGEIFSCAESGRCTIATMHASDTRSALARLAAGQAPVETPQQMLLWYAVHVQKIAGEGGGVFRRVGSIAELYAGDGGLEVQDLFTHGNADEALQPSGPEDLCAKSRRIAQAARILGVEPLEDVQKRAALLRECTDKKAYGLQETFAILKKYYRAA